MAEIKVKSVEFHRNGVAGESFYAIRFRDKETLQDMFAVVFGFPGCVAVFDFNKLSDGDIGHGQGNHSNTWRGEYYETALRVAASEFEESAR